MSAGLSGRRFFVSGAGRGIGLACVARLVAAGARVGCIDRDEEALAALATRFADGEVLPRRGDVAQPAEVNEAVEACADAFGGLDGLVCSAGIDLVAPLEETGDEVWRRLFAVNLDGCMHVCRAGLPHLRAAGGGTIVGISSAAGLQPLSQRAAYCASKAGLQMFLKALALEVAGAGIRVNSVCPGAVETDLLRMAIDAAPNPRAARAAVRGRYALGRIAEPDEIAAAVLWLSSAESSFVTGIAMAVDGGRTFH